MIRNKRTRRIISYKEIRANNLFSQGHGLMFRSRQNLIMVFTVLCYVSLHNFFVFYPLEILVLDSRMKIIAIKEEFKPFTFWSFRDQKAKYCIELGLEKSKGLCKIGDVLEVS